MSTDAYLAGLNLDQLYYARDRADALIKGKQAEKKRVVWRVEEDGFGIRFYPQDRYVEAAEYLLEKAKKLAGDSLRLRQMALSLVPDFVLESEYAEYEKDFPPVKPPAKDGAQ